VHLHLRWRRESRAIDATAPPRWSFYCQLELTRAEAKLLTERNLWDRTIGAVVGLCAGSTVRRLAQREWLLCAVDGEAGRAAIAPA